MQVLVIGSGAREHAIVWKLAQSPRVNQIYAAPGNPGMMAQAECIPLGVTQFAELADFAERKRIDLTIVGPEVPLVEGIADFFRRRGLRIFGPDAAGAALEGSKAFAKELMPGAGIPTAQHRTFTDATAAQAYLEEHGVPVVVKADGNAAGKGAIVALDMETARNAVQQMMVERVFGAAGDVVVIEDYLQGDEIGSTAICNGTHYLPLPLSQDHKRALDNDQGLNTGGMGVYTPLPFVNGVTETQIQQRIISATLQALQERGIDFSGVLYSNIMLTQRGPMVLEHNTRFGDPETQAFMMLLQDDIMKVLAFAETASPAAYPEIAWHKGYSVSLTLASQGYPGKYPTGIPITGIEEANRLEQTQVFHAGTALRDGRLVTAGGRVLSIAARGETLPEAVARVYEAAAHISFEGMHYRRDIAHRGLRAKE
ncbi:MAG TPA: phosphoribosylamine--glycine ligase [Ktedonobacteraceae bacterium]|jgi:phosphoribosylamine--glycine ligase|nr:phosphoribosylamine--glycine ligase [Ktedonobacteraceae bacterium]